MTDLRERVARAIFAASFAGGERREWPWDDADKWDDASKEREAYERMADAAIAATGEAQGVRVKDRSPDGLSQIDQLRLHVEHDLSPPCLESLLDEIEALTTAPITPAQALSKNDIYYLKAIYRRLDEFRQALDGIEGLSIGGEAFADERDWLDCFISKHEPPAQQDEDGEGV